jgi:hypothetical protein
MSRTNIQVLQEANPSKVDATFNRVGLGDAFGNITRNTRGTVTTNELALPNDAKALVVLHAYATAGTTAGEKTGVDGGAPLAGEVSVTPTGDIIFNATDAVTAAEVTYVAVEGDLVTAQIAVTAAGATDLPGERTAKLLIEASLDFGSSSGAKTVVARGSAPGAGEAAIGDDGEIAFNGTDVGASPVTATVTYIEFPAETVSEALSADSAQ